MSAAVTCPACLKDVPVPRELLGHKVHCPGCMHTFTAILDEPRLEGLDDPKLADLDEPKLAPMDEPMPGEPMPGVPDMTIPHEPPVAEVNVVVLDEPGKAEPPVPPPLPPSAVPEWEKPRPGSVLMPEEEFEKPIEEPPELKKPKKAKKGKAGSPYYDELTQRQRRMQLPHRGPTILVLGILSLLCSPGFLLAIGAAACGYYAYQMGSYDLNEMQSGRMDRSGEPLTKVGRMLGLIGACLSGPFILLSMCCLVGSLVNALMGRR